ncbi:MAG: aldehyde dehydrogenase [Abyssibacter sp.]|nr:aldehyde dehydrogenase [Abyssibacter sp.]MCK5860817.1 aldehyde dehydrogenase [Abyssibacter sp.]
MSLLNYIDGRWEAPAIEMDESVRDASTGEVLFWQRSSTADQIERALKAADAAHASGVWMAMSPQARADKLNAIADEMLGRDHAIAVADARATGVIVALTDKFAQICAGAFRQAAELCLNPPQPTPREGSYGPLAIERLPLGPAAIIAPWNAPSGIAAHKAASALAAGCPVLLKPSEWAPMSAQLMTEAAASVGLPNGLWQLLHGDGAVGAALTSDTRVRAVSFTGGLQGGRAVAAACADGIKPAQLELGGNNPLVVLKDADLDAAADGVVTALITLNGQWCRALGRLLVHQTVCDALLDRVRERLATVRLGNAMDAESQMGPLVSQRHHALVQTHVAQLLAQGGQVLTSTAVPDLPGWFVAPTLVTGLDPEQTLEEIFGPVATVHCFESDDEAVHLANQTPFGLAAYVFGEENHAWSIANRLRAGLIKLNAVSMLNLHPQAPRPAWGLSGLGDEGTVETFEFFRGTRVIGVAGRTAVASDTVAEAQAG